MGFPLMYPRIAVTSADVTNRLMPGRFQRGTSPPLGNPQVSRRGFYSGRQSLELTGATHPRFRATSAQIPYHLLSRKRESKLIPLRLLSKPDPLTLGSDLGFEACRDSHPPRRGNRGSGTETTEQERQRSKEQRQCRFAAPSCFCRNFRQIDKRKYIETMGFYARLW